MALCRRILFISWQIIACYAPVFWAAYQIHAFHNPTICVPASTPFHTRVGEETVLDFRPEGRNDIYEIQIASTNETSAPNQGITQTVLPVNYDAFCNGVKIALKNKAIWKACGNGRDAHLTIYSSRSLRTGRNAVYTIRVRPKKSLAAYALTQPQLRVYSFGRYYGYAMPLIVEHFVLALLFTLVGTILFLRRLARFA